MKQSNVFHQKCVTSNLFDVTQKPFNLRYNRGLQRNKGRTVCFLWYCKRLIIYTKVMEAS